MRIPMQVTSVNSTAASAISPQPADDTARRADDFARVLQNAFYGAGSKAVANGAQQASEATPRTETRPVERAERPVTDRPVEQRPAESRDETAKTETAPRDQAANPAEKPAQKTDKPAADTKSAQNDAAADAEPADAPTAEETVKADAGKTAGDAGEELAEAKDETKPAVAVAADAALILSLLQTQMPVAVATVAPTATPAVDGEAAAAPVVVAPVVAAPVAAAPVAAAAPAAPVDAAAALAAAAAQSAAAQAAAPVAPQAAAETVAPDAAKALADAAAAAAQAGVQTPVANTETSAAALLSQQQSMSKEDFAAIQQALANQAQAQLQADVQTVEVEPEQQVHLLQPQLAAAASTLVAPKSEGKTEKSNLTVDVQTVSAVAPKTLVDQSTLMTMQGDDDLADAALLQQQAQAQAQQQPVGADVKFAATLQSQLVNDAAQPVNVAAAPHAPAHLTAQTGTAPAGQTAQAAQASHAASQQTLARNLNAYIPAGEQVAVQIKKGAAEGIDKISIRLDPGNLGNVEIKMEVGHDGRLMAVIAADKPETLQMLQKDAASLEQSLREAGLKTDQQSLSFSLRDQNQAQSGRDGRDGAGYGRQRGGRGTDEYADTSRVDPAQVAAAQAQRAAAARGGLDIKI